MHSKLLRLEMEFWEFLVQKEGDRSWLPLESASVEILEGRYRIVGRSSRADALVEISITQTAIAGDQPTRRKRSARTNQAGLVVILPYTDFQPGLWECRCAADPLDDFLGDRWQYAVQMQVVSTEAGATWDDTDSILDDVYETEYENITATQSEQFQSERFQSEYALANQFTDDDGSGEYREEYREYRSDAELDHADQIQGQAIAAREVSPEPVSDEGTTIADSITASADIQADSSMMDVAVIHSDAAHSDTVHAVTDSAIADLIAAMTDTDHAEAEGLDNTFSDLLGDRATTQESDRVSVVETSVTSASIAEVTDAEVTDAEVTDAEVTDAEVTDAEVTDAEVTDVSMRSQIIPLPKVRIRLDQELYIIPRGSNLVLAGKIEPDGEAVSAGIIAALHVRLLDPRTSQVLSENTRSLENAPALPFPLFCQVDLPAAYETFLIIGELSLLGQKPSDQAEAPVLAKQSFSVTTELHQLLQAIADHSEATGTLPTKEPVRPPASYLNAAPASQSFFQFRSTSPLPPQLHQPKPQARSEKVQRLDLPTFRLSARDLMEAEQKKQSNQPPQSNQSMAPQSKTEGVTSSVMNSALNSSLNSSLKQPGDDRRSFDLSAPYVAPESRFNLLQTEPDQRDQRDGEMDAIATATHEVSHLDQVNQVDLDDLSHLDELQLSQSRSLIPVPESNLTENLTESVTEDQHSFTDADEVSPDLSQAWDRADAYLMEDSFGTEPEPTDPVEHDPETGSFQSLNLRDRFWNRLQSFATDPELSNWMKGSPAQMPRDRFISGYHTEQPIDELEVIDDVSETSGFTAQQALYQRLENGRSARRTLDRYSREQQLEQPTGRPEVDSYSRDDHGMDQSASLHHSVSGSYNQAPGSDDVTPITPSKAAIPTLSEDEEIPCPFLDVPSGELVAGRPVQLFVRLPKVHSQIFVKLWVQDRQTRTLLDGPRWLVAFQPDQNNTLSTLAQVTVPYGSVEVQFEAIAIEIATQRESDKVSIGRRVIPPEVAYANF